MDEHNAFAKELADAIAVAVSESAQVEACRQKAREAGLEMKVTLEAVVMFYSRINGTELAKVFPTRKLLPAGRGFDLTAYDRDYMKSLRIQRDEIKEQVDEG